MPLPRRYLTSLMCRYNGSNILIDCGEGTQVAIKQKGWSFKPIDVLCITHYHADHISGLPGLLLTMGNAERTEPLLMIGPKGLEKVVNSLRIIAPELPFDIEFIELTENLQTIQMEEYRIKAFKVNHKVTCYGYSIEIDRSGKFNPEKAKKLGIPLQKWGVLQKGESVEINGVNIPLIWLWVNLEKALKLLIPQIQDRFLILFRQLPEQICLYVKVCTGNRIRKQKQKSISI